MRQRPSVESIDPKILFSADAGVLLPDATPWSGVAERRMLVDADHRGEWTLEFDSAEPRTEVVFVDERVPDVDGLVGTLGASRPNLQVVVIDADADGVQVVSDYLARHSGIAAVHIVSHGDVAALQLGSTRLDGDALAARSQQVAQWSAALTADADLLLYGCNVGQGEQGRAFVAALGKLTGADVAASTDITGNTSAGGNWTFELQQGVVEAGSLLDQGSAFKGTLGITPQGTETLVHVSASGSQWTEDSAQAVAVDGAGNFVVVWMSGGDVYARLFAADGTASGAEFRVNTTTSDSQSEATVAMDGNGSFVVAWTSRNQDGSGNGVYAQRYDAAGVALGGEFLVNQHTQGSQFSPALALAPNGSFIVTWTAGDNQDGSGYGIYMRRYDAAGNPLDGEIRVNAETNGDQWFSQVAIDASGNFVIVWEGEGTTGDIYGRRFDSGGSALASEFRVNTTTSDVQDRPHVVMAPDGDFVVLWSSDGQDGSGWGTYAQRYDATGAARGSEFRINATTSQDQDLPMAAIDNHGNLFVVWRSYDQDALGDSGIYSRLFDSNGNPVTGEVLVNGTTSGYQGGGSVAWNGTDAVVVWSGNGIGDSAGVFFQRMEVTPPEIRITSSHGNTTEGGGTATYSVVLTSQPTADVTIPFFSSNPGEATLSASSLTFTAANWNSPQVLTVTGVDDAVADGDQPYWIFSSPAVSADPNYNGLHAIDENDIVPMNIDDDVAGVNVSAISGNTTEAGDSATFSVVLTSQPTADVTISIVSNDPTEGTVSTSSLVFTAANWNIAQTVTVTGIDDAVDDGNVGYTVVTSASSADPVFDGMDVADVSVTNVDDDSAEIRIISSHGNTTEAGGSATYSVVLTSQPTADVTISLFSSNPDEATIASGSLTFTAANWNSAQVVTVTGVDDAVADGDQPYWIFSFPAVSADPNYNGLHAIDENDIVPMNIDDDVAGVNVSAISGNTNEAGGTATFSVVLTSQPTADVTISVASNDTTEGTVSTSSLTFTAANWNVAQTVTVTGVDDAVDDGDITYTIITGAAVSADANYNGMAVADVSVTTLDDDTAGVSVSAISGNTTEAGGIATFSVVLTSQPIADVTISIASSDTTEGAVSTSALTFTAANWNVAQVVTVIGVDDAVDDGDIAYTIVASAAVSADADYNGMAVADVSVTNLDNDTAGVSVSPISGPTTEAGGTATFSVVLTSQPTADVTISIASGDTTEGTVSTASLTFTAANWNVAQTVTVTGLDDAVADSDTTYAIVTGAAASVDANYNGMVVADVAVVNLDNDTAGVSVSAISGPTTEAGGTATFSVVLTSQPTANVTISIASSDTSEGTVSTSSLTFTAANWNVAQVVTVTGVDDAVADGDIAYSIVTGAASADLTYNGMAVVDVAVTNLDNDTAGVSVSPISGPTTEAGGTTTFGVMLTSQPTADVTISIASSDTTEGTVSASSLTFTAANWNVAQVVTVTGVDDVVDDGDIAYTIVTGAAVSADAGYSGMAAADVAVTNVDNDSAGISVSAISGNTTEAGSIATFSVVLTSQPTADVIISIASSDTTEGAVSTSSLVFTAANWSVAQVVTVTGVDDALDDGDIAYTIVTGTAVSADASYNGMSVADVSVTNLDDDTAGVSVSVISRPTTEAGGNASSSVVLTSQPTADVTISIASSDTTEGTVSTSSLTFTAANWNVAQTVAVTGVDDAVVDGDIAYAIVTGAAVSADASYNGMSVADVSVTNLDDDTAGVSVSPISGPTTEAGGTATFSVVLTSQPTADMTISIASNDTTEGTASTSSLTFTAANWNVAQVVTVTGVDDAVADGDVAYSIVTGAAVSADAGYNGMAAADVAVTNVDNESAGVSVSAISGSTTEAGGTATFSVVLTSQPTADVIISIASSDTTEGTVSTSSLVFTAANWNVAQVVTVTGLDDALDDGDVGYSVVTGTASSSDAAYDGLAVADVSVTNQGIDDQPVIGAPTGVTTAEDVTLAWLGLDAVTVSDGNGNLASVQLSVAHGSIRVDLGGGAQLTAGAQDSATLTLSGTQAELQAALATLTYRGQQDFHGSDALQIVAADLAGQTDHRSVPILVTPLDDAPTLAVGTLAVTPGGALVLGPSHLSVADPDSPARELSYLVTSVSHGWFERVGQPGVEITGFSVDDVAAGRIRLVHDASASPPAFVIAAQDAQSRSASAQVQVALYGDPVAPPPPVVLPPTPEPVSDPDAPAPPDTTPTTTASPPAQAPPVVIGTTSSNPLAPAVQAATAVVPPVVQVAGTSVQLGDRDRSSSTEEAPESLPTLDLRALMLNLADFDGRSGQGRGGGDQRLSVQWSGDDDADDAAWSDRLSVVMLQTASLALLVGGAGWALRVGGLLASLLAALPTWRQVDLLPVLADDDVQDAAEGDDDAAESSWADLSDDAEAVRDEHAIAQVWSAGGSRR